jgi:hypothetical protein
MQQVVEGKLYDTETATPVAVWTHEGWHWYRETLHMTRRGNWFINRESGAGCLSIFLEGHLRALTPEEAQGWLAEHTYIDALETYFPGTVEAA